jgi:hypothetical protein
MKARVVAGSSLAHSPWESLLPRSQARSHQPTLAAGAARAVSARAQRRSVLAAPARAATSSARGLGTRFDPPRAEARAPDSNLVQTASGVGCCVHGGRLRVATRVPPHARSADLLLTRASERDLPPPYQRPGGLDARRLTAMKVRSHIHIVVPSRPNIEEHGGVTCSNV